MIALAAEPPFWEWDAASAFEPLADCNPNGAVISSIDSVIDGPNPTAGQIIVYHSPGLICLSGWETVGAAAKINPTSTSISGAINISNVFPTGSAFFEPDLDFILAALEPGETAAVCCPSSYTTYGGDCYSTLPSSVFTPSVGVQRYLPPGDIGTTSGIFTIGGQTVTAELAEFMATTPLSTTSTLFAASDLPSLVGVAVQDMFILIHQASDTAGVAGSSSTASSTGGSSSTKPNSAVRTRGSEKRFAVVTVVCCVAFALETLFVI